MTISTRWLTGAVLLGALSTAALLSARPNTATAQGSRATAQATELVGGPWLNTGGKPLTLASRRGEVTVVHFWTFACSNCLANIPAYNRIDQKFRSRGVEVIGVHTPESGYEGDPKNVARRVKALEIRYPVLLDAKNQNWNRWNQRFWPTIYLIDRAGKVRFKHEGELRGDEAAFTRNIETLLAERAPAGR